MLAEGWRAGYATSGAGGLGDWAGSLHGLKTDPGFAGGGFVALAGRGYAVAGCAPGVAHPAGQHTFSGAAHTPA